MSRRAYAGGAASSTLSSGITSGTTSVGVADASSWPSSGAFTIVIDRGLAGEEKILVGSRSGNTLTVTTRGYDGTTAAAHASAAVVEHCGTAVDFDEANAHVNASAAVHGLSGTVVGTTDSQTLTNKTLTAPVIAIIVNTGTLTLPTATDTLLGRATTDTLTNKSISGAANTLSNIPESAVTNLTTDLAAKAADSAVVHNTGNETVAGVKTFSSKPVADNLPLIAAGTPTLVASGQLGYDTTNDVLGVRRAGMYQPIWGKTIAPVALGTTSTSGTTELVVGTITNPYSFQIETDATIQWPNLVKTVAGDGFWVRLYADGILIGQQFVEATTAVNAGGRTMTLPVSFAGVQVLEWRLVRASGTGTAAFASGGFCWVRMQG